VTGLCQWTFGLPDFGFPSDVRGARSQPFHSDAKVSVASEHRRDRKKPGPALFGESTSPGPGGGGENLLESALPVDSLLALDPFHIHDIERTACQLLIPIHESHTIAELIKFEPSAKTYSLNNAAFLADRAFISAMLELEVREPNTNARLAPPIL
jgi:hypothetical protein